MGRQRKTAANPANGKTAKNARNSGGSAASANTGGGASHSSSSAGSATPVKPAKGGRSLVAMSQWRVVFGCCCLAIASYFGYIGYLETRVNTPFDDQKMVQRSGLHDAERYWGSYRPGNYFGLKTRDPHSPVMGLMWYLPSRLRPGGEGVRHWCEIGDNLDKYGWLEHDGKSFGLQEIHDYPFLLETSFVKFSGGQFGGDWTARIAVKSSEPNINEEISLIWYTALDEKTGGIISPEMFPESSILGLKGETPGLGEFTMTIYNTTGEVEQHSYLSTIVSNFQTLRQTIITQLHIAQNKRTNKRFIALPGESLPVEEGRTLLPNFVATQVSGRVPFTIDVVFRSGAAGDETPLPIIYGDKYTEALQEKREKFGTKFESVFELQRKGYSEKDVKFAQAALSNMLGGIGYFYGSSRVQSVHTKEPVPYWKAPLYSAVPSRSFFPRGFLWDEGFHGLLISTWDLDIELDIISHWFDLMNVEGWIPREQILGAEALAKVPEEFVTQRNSNANPPTFFLTLKRIITRYGNELTTRGRLSTLERLYPRLQAWFTWFNTTQKGDLPGTYRWRGRDYDSLVELNPKTLTSGLDDYPRASNPTDNERHVDLHCWIAFAAGVMADLARLLGRDDDKYWETHYYLSDNHLLNELHLSPYTETYSDWGLHTDSVVLKRPQPTQQQQQNFQRLDKVRMVLKSPEYRFVDSTYGYISLFPFLLEILTPDSPFLAKIFKDIRDPNILWTDFGLRSLSKTAPLYMKRNTEHDPPYWRGQIWININYLALKALYHYSGVAGPFAEDAKILYAELRQNVVNNVIRQYDRTGYIWEQYNDRTGEGSGCKPFTGWSGLVTLIMAEQY